MDNTNYPSFEELKSLVDGVKRGELSYIISAKDGGAYYGYEVDFLNKDGKYIACFDEDLFRGELSL